MSNIKSQNQKITLESAKQKRKILIKRQLKALRVLNKFKKISLYFNTTQQLS